MSKNTLITTTEIKNAIKPLSSKELVALVVDMANASPQAKEILR